MHEPNLQAEVELLESLGLTPSEIATHLNITLERATQLCSADETHTTINEQPAQATQLPLELVGVYKTRNIRNERAKECLEMYRNGHTLEEIGTKYYFTRERARQIIRQQVGVELGFGPAEQKSKKEEINLAVKSLVITSRGDRASNVVMDKIEKATSEGIDYKYFDSIIKYCSAVGVSAGALKTGARDVYDVIKKNQSQRNRRWSTYYDQCKQCGTTSIKHKSLGYCNNCYSKSPEFKKLVQRSNMKHRTARLATGKRYYDGYKRRPEVIARKEMEYDKKYFGGNRVVALARDNNRCIGCGMSTEEKNADGRPKVRVWHLGDKNDNSLEKLATYCQSCFVKASGGTWMQKSRDS